LTASLVDPNIKGGLPWLYYQNNPQKAILDKNIDLTVSFVANPADASRTQYLTY
jgi:hypothetical protein